MRFFGFSTGQLSLLGLLAYTLMQLRAVYFPQLTLLKIHECMVHVDR